MNRLILTSSLALLAACAAPETATRANIQPGPPPAAVADASGTCWARETTPAVYEHVMGEVQVVQAQIGEDGTVIQPPIYRKAPVPRIVRARSEMKFEAPCPSQITPEFLSSLQRALAVRGYFGGNVTGLYDAPTSAAVKVFQTERGLESDQLSLQTARDLGLIAVDLSAPNNG